MTKRSTGPACGNNPNHQLSEGDRQAVDMFSAYLAARTELRVASHRLAQVRDAARLHRHQLIGTSELYAVIEAEPATVQPPADRAAILRELADQQEQTAATDVIRKRRSIATARRLFAVELRRLAAEAQQQGEGEAPTAADTQQMLTRMRANAATHALDHLLGLISRWAASSEGRDVLLEDLVAGGYRLPHACGNCEGIDPDTCLKNPNRSAPVAQQPAAEAWVCKCPAGLCGCGHHAPTEQQPAAADGEALRDGAIARCDRALAGKVHPPHNWEPDPGNGLWHCPGDEPFAI